MHAIVTGLARLRVRATVDELDDGRVCVRGASLHVSGDAETIRLALALVDDRAPAGDAWVAMWDAAGSTTDRDRRRELGLVAARR